MAAINGTEEDEIEDWAERWKTCLALGLSCALDSGAKDKLTASDAHVAFHDGPDLHVDEVPCNVW